MLHGIVPDSQQNGLGNKGGIDNVIRGVSTSILGENNGDTNLTKVGSMVTSGLNANWASGCDGLNATDLDLTREENSVKRGRFDSGRKQY